MTHPAWLSHVPEPTRSELIDQYEERASIRQHDGRQARFAAEMGAWDDVRRWHFGGRDESRRRLGDGVAIRGDRRPDAAV